MIIYINLESLPHAFFVENYNHIEFYLNDKTCVVIESDELETEYNDSEKMLKLKGVYFNDIYANGLIDDVKDRISQAVILCDSEEIEITDMKIVDGDREWVYIA